MGVMPRSAHARPSARRSGRAGPEVTLALLDSFRLESNGEILELPLGSQRLIALLAVIRFETQFSVVIKKSGANKVRVG